MSIKKIIYGLGGLLTGLLLEFFQDRQMSIEVEEQVQKALEERFPTQNEIIYDVEKGEFVNERRDSESDHVIFEAVDSKE